MSYKKAKELLTKYKDGTATDEEKAFVEKLLFSYNDGPLELSEERYDEIIDEIWNELPKPAISPIRRLPVWTKVAAAASVVIALSAGLYFIKFNKPAQQVAQNKVQDIVPGSSKATLTLATGQKIVLTTGLNGKLAQQGNTSVQINSGNAITYTASGANNSASAPVQYNTLSTRRGEQSPYPLVLADGTKVWLNAESSITFPTIFNGKERVVQITGEAYLEVIHNVAQPFKVRVRDQIIEDLGTRFNINAYTDEPNIKTSLIQGAIKLSNNKQTVYLKPGYQAVTPPSGSITVQAVDIDQIMAWKNGNFDFESVPLSEIMRQISRWYNVDVSYKGDIAAIEFSCSISRSRNINEILSELEATKSVHFKIEGRRILVMP